MMVNGTLSAGELVRSEQYGGGNNGGRLSVQQGEEAASSVYFIHSTSMLVLDMLLCTFG